MWLIVCLSLINLNFHPITENSDIRKQFFEATNNQKAAKDLLNGLNQKKVLTNLESGYLGSTKMIMAQYYFLPWQKYQSFTEGKSLLESAINKEPKNIELLFLRYMIQTNTPSFLHYSESIASDKAFIENNLNGVRDEDLKQLITQYLKK